ncbi:MAG: nucleoside deaminase [Candidatus Krumholzibacteria bacterium]
MDGDRRWMEQAIAEAQSAADNGEVPVGAVVVHRGEVVGRGHNRVEQTGYPFEHAEVVALWDAVARRDRWVLTDASLYVTVEPCVMCVGALLLARVPRVVFGTREPKTGACESVLAIPNEPRLEHRIAVIGGVEERRCRELLQDFFRKQRKRDGA